MSGVLRVATAAALVVGLSGIAYAQPYSQRAYDGQAQFYALYSGRSEAFERPRLGYGVVPPSVSHTVMGLRVPR